MVIGILIALQINNWNNERIERKLETNILKEILVNLKKDVNNLNSKINFNLDKITVNKKVLEHLEAKTPLTDSLRLSYFNLIGRGNFEPITVAYANLKAKGVDIIKSDSLRIAISELYDFKYYYITEDLRRDYESTKVLHESEFHKNVKVIFGEGQTLAEPINLLETQNNIHFKEALKQALIFYVYMNKLYENGIMENEELQKLIEIELSERGK
ncbi:hypothetical protein GCM10023330_04020 [Litoribaculum gwangyangense]|uniref:Uncharacterized protein n=1 Tax=Litoribaculum gwangyangense TaxID=1130722 RepID=A0ABP9BZ87_9FLAO